MRLAIDGEIFQNAHLTALSPEREIFLIPKIGGRLSLCAAHCSGIPALHRRVPCGGSIPHRDHSLGNPAR
jgi:hypothetical protein